MGETLGQSVESFAVFDLISPEAIRKVAQFSFEKDFRGYKAVRYNVLPLMLLQALKEQQEIVRRQQAENADLQARLETLEKWVVAKEALAQK